MRTTTTVLLSFVAAVLVDGLRGSEVAATGQAPPTGVVVPWRLEVITRFTPGG